MKRAMKIFAAAAILLCGLTTANAKQSTKFENVTFQTEIDCPKCEAKIMKVLPYQKGVKDVIVDLKTKSVTVKFDPNKSSKSAIQSSLTKLDVKVIKCIEPIKK